MAIKLYGADGCQLTPEAADAVQREIEAQADIAPLPDFEAPLAQGAIRWVDDATVDAYFVSVQAVGFGVPEAPLSVVYSPLNGAGNQPVRRMLREIGNVAVHIVPQQELPDGNFPTCPYPNPEAASAMTLAAQLARQTNADFFFATDPDCDRIGAGLWDGETMRLFSGNEMSVLLFDYICTRRAELGTMPACPVAVTTVVSTPMLDALAKKHGVALRKVLTGFKYIGEQVGLLEQEGQAERFLFGCEESCGYLMGLSVRDKDAVNAVMLLCQMAAYHKARGKNLAQALMGLYETYGFYQTALLHFAFEGACGMDRMGRILDHMRRTCTAHFAGYPVQSRVDYEADKTGLPQCNMLFFALEQGGCVFIRPSGTEPKLKLYLTEVAQSAPLAAQRLAALQTACRTLIGALAAEK